MKKKLSITDRLHLLSMLPREGNVMTLRILDELRN